MIATGFLRQSVVQVLGGIIPCVAALERVFANLSRLLAVTAAKNAYDRVRRAVVARHNHEIVDVVRIRDRQPKTAADNLVNMDRKLNKLLAFDMERGLLEVEAGLQWPGLLEALHKAQAGREREWAFNQ